MQNAAKKRPRRHIAHGALWCIFAAAYQPRILSIFLLIISKVPVRESRYAVWICSSVAFGYFACMSSMVFCVQR